MKKPSTLNETQQKITFSFLQNYAAERCREALDQVCFTKIEKIEKITTVMAIYHW